MVEPRLKIVWAPQAESDLTEGVAYIARDSVTAGLDVEDRVLQAVERLADYPSMGRAGRLSTGRELVVARTPYVVVYEVGADLVEIMRIWHTSQAPLAQPGTATGSNG